MVFQNSKYNVCSQQTNDSACLSDIIHNRPTIIIAQ
jgi:hypothetical protein